MLTRYDFAILVVKELTPWRFVIFSLCLTLVGIPTADAQPVFGALRTPDGLNPRAVVVLPFTNISAQPLDDWIGWGIAETITVDLERTGSLRIVGREALLDTGGDQVADLASGSETIAREISRDLGVTWIITGGFQRTGRQLRVIARIVDVETGDTLETVTVDGTLDQIFELQDRIVTELGAGFELLAGDRTLNRTAVRQRLSPLEAEGKASTPLVDAAHVPGHAESVRETSETPTPEAVSSGQDPQFVSGDLAIGVSGNADPGVRVTNESTASSPAALGALAGRPIVRPTRTDTPPVIDGRLDDAVWRTAAKITELVQQRPLDGAPATEDTEIYIAYDSNNLYFGFYLHYSDSSILRANRVDRDRAFSDDLMTVYLDTFLDQQRAYDFDVNGYGVQGDGIVNADRRAEGRGRGIPPADRSWDALFYTGAQIVEDGYIAEMAIPFKSLRYPQRGQGVPHKWGLQIVREIKYKNEENDVWAPMSRDIAGFLPQMGVLEGMTDLSTSRNIEILPTFTAIDFGSLDESTGKFTKRDPAPEGGVNFKYGLTSNLTADFTFNPDFSQIESDRPQIEVNQRFPLFFPELRPFFLEGAEIFEVGGPVTFVHTRTIVDPLYGAKLTGKVGRTSVGILAANDEGPGNLDDPTDPVFGQNAQTVIGRVKYDLYSESFVGGIFTDRQFLDGYSRLAGTDGNFRLGQTHSTRFRAMATRHRDLEGIERDGHLFDVGLSKNGRNLSYYLTAYEVSPDFKTDVGFVRRTDQRNVLGSISYRWWPENWIMNWGPRFSYGRLWNFNNVLEDERAGMRINISLARNIRFNAGINRNMERFGGINFDKAEYSISGGVSTSNVFQFSGSFRQGDQIFFDHNSPFLGRAKQVRINATLRPMSRLQSRLSVNTSRFLNPANASEEVFDVKIFRTFTTYQFTDRLLLRNINEYNTWDNTVDANLLVTYRVNAGTVFFFGYDDHYQQADQIFDLDDEFFFASTDLRRTNRAVFTKLQYLFRY